MVSRGDSGCRGQGLTGEDRGVGIDETGTGFVSLSLVLEVVPEFIKLDRELTGNIDLDQSGAPSPAHEAR